MSFVENRLVVAGKIRITGGASLGEGGPPFQLKGSLQSRVWLSKKPVPVQICVPAAADEATVAATVTLKHQRANTELRTKEQNVVFMMAQ